MSNPNTIFILTRDDVIGCAKQISIPEEAITDDVLYQVKKGLESGLECWADVMMEALRCALQSAGTDRKICPGCGKPIALCLCVRSDDQ